MKHAEFMKHAELWKLVAGMGIHYGKQPGDAADTADMVVAEYEKRRAPEDADALCETEPETETDWAKVPSDTTVFVWDDDPKNAQERRYIGYHGDFSFPHVVACDDGDVDRFAFAKLVAKPEPETETDWAKVPSGTKVFVWGDDPRASMEGTYVEYHKNAPLPHMVVVRDEGEVGCFTHARLAAKPEPETDWAAVRSGTKVVVWDGDPRASMEGTYVEYHKNAPLPHLVVMHAGSRDAEAMRFTHAKLVAKPETETDWAAVRSGTQVVVWDNDLNYAQERRYLGYQDGALCPHHVIEDYDTYTHAKLVGGTE